MLIRHRQRPPVGGVVRRGGAIVPNRGRGVTPPEPGYPPVFAKAIAGYASEGMIVSGSKVTDWIDATGNGHMLSQANMTYQPGFLLDAGNGHPALDFGSVANNFHLSLAGDVPINVWNAIVILRWGTGANTTTESATAEFCLFGGGNYRCFVNASGTHGSPSSYGVPYRNGVAPYTPLLPWPLSVNLYDEMVNMPWYRVGARSTGASDHGLTGMMQEAWFFGELLTADEMWEATEYLGGKFGIAVTDGYTLPAQLPEFPP